MRVLVTGGAGFIGSHVAEALAAAGNAVAVLDDLSTGRRENVPPGAALYEADVRDAAAVESAVGEFRPDVLCHHAAQIDVARSIESPAADAEVNVLGSLTLLEACRRAGVRRVLFASSCAVYGEQREFPASEEHPTRPVSPYGVAKLSVEKYLHYYEAQHGVAWTAMRYANVYGPRQSTRGEAGVVAIFAGRLLRGEAPSIYGDGEQTRDYVYVGDVVRANLLALERDVRGPVNVGTGEETSVRELYRLTAGLVGSRLEAAAAPARAGEQRRSCLSSDRLHAHTGWRPGVSLREGLAETVNYYGGGTRG